MCTHMWRSGLSFESPIQKGARRHTREMARDSRARPIFESQSTVSPFPVDRARALVNLPYDPPGVCQSTRRISVDEQFLTTDVALPATDLLPSRAKANVQCLLSLARNRYFTKLLQISNT